MQAILPLLAVAQLPQQYQWPKPPTVTCAWNKTSEALEFEYKWAEGQVELTDLVELGASVSPLARPFVVWTAVWPLSYSLDLNELLPSTTYYFSVRGHSRNGSASCPSSALSAETWGRYSKPVECTTGAGTPKPRVEKSEAPVVIETVRLSEATTHVDYMAAHDSGDMAGDVLLLTQLAQYESLFGSGSLSQTWVGLPMEAAALQLGCVESLKPSLPGNVTTYGNDSFTDYLSCNRVPCGPYPGCTCAVGIDRLWANIDISPPMCHKPNPLDPLDKKTPCERDNSTGYLGACECECDAKAANESQFYTGMEPVYAHEDDAPVGRWYSHPYIGWCAPNVPLGTPNGYKVPCTWRQRPQTRVIRTWQLLNDPAFNYTVRTDCKNPGATNCRAPKEQVLQNAEVLRKLFDALPLPKWQC